MSVLIKGMKMPHSCLDCKFQSCGSMNEWEVFCDITGNRVGFWDDKKWINGWRSSRCPLIEVPAPHGRLIDEDALKVKFTKTDANGINLELDRYALKCIEAALTIIEAEEGEKE